MNRKYEYKKRYNPSERRFVKKHVYGEGVFTDVFQKIFGKTTKKVVKETAKKLARDTAKLYSIQTNSEGR